MMHATNEHAKLMIYALNGEAGHKCRDALDLFNWSNCWPVVDEDGDLTGEIAEGAADGYALVDISDGGTITADGCQFAMDAGSAEALFCGDDDEMDELDWDIEAAAPGASGKMLD